MPGIATAGPRPAPWLAMTGLEGLEGGTRHDGLGAVELLTQAVELIEGVQVQLRQQLVAGDQELELGDPDEDLLLHDVGLEA